MTDREDDGQPDPVPQPPHPMDTALAREHAAKTIARGRQWDCDCLICNRLRAAGWRPELDSGAWPFAEQVASHIAGDAYSAIFRLLMMRGSQAARKAFDVAAQGVSALATPNDPKLAATVERMYRAFVGADEQERVVVFEVERAVMAVLYGDHVAAVRRLHDDLAAVIVRHHARVAVPDDATLAAALTGCEEKFAAAMKKDPAARKIQTSGAIARILHAMRWFGADPPETLEKVIKRVSEAQRARRVRSGEHVVKPRKRTTKKRATKKRAKRL